jgi:hypothetical protein
MSLAADGKKFAVSFNMQYPFLGRLPASGVGAYARLKVNV